nr:NAP1-related protein 2-like isoform X2 [Ipomoea batatas]
MHLFGVFLSHPVISELLTEEDQKIFKFLSSIEVEDSKDVKSELQIQLYFEDTKLMKSYAFKEEGATQITATPIKWKEGTLLTWFSETQQKDEDMDDIHDEV